MTPASLLFQRASAGNHRCCVPAGSVIGVGVRPSHQGVRVAVAVAVAVGVSDGMMCVAISTQSSVGSGSAVSCGGSGGIVPHSTHGSSWL